MTRSSATTSSTVPAARSALPATFSSCAPHVDGNTTDGDGGAIYTDEDGDVTVIDSTVDGNTADGPGGAIFTPEGDVAGDRPSTATAPTIGEGAISGEADVTVINSTIARNAAFAHVRGGIWARSDLYATNSTISHNYAEGEGGGVLAAGVVGLVNSTVADNVAPVAADVGAGSRLRAFGSVIGPPDPEPVGGQRQPIGPSCRVSRPESSGYNFVSDASLRPQRPERRDRHQSDACPPPGRQRRPRGDPHATAGQSSGGLDPRRRMRLRPVWLLAGGRAASRAVRDRPARAHYDRPTRHRPTAGRRMRLRRG